MKLRISKRHILWNGLEPFWILIFNGQRPKLIIHWRVGMEICVSVKSQTWHVLFKLQRLIITSTDLLWRIISHFHAVYDCREINCMWGLKFMLDNFSYEYQGGCWCKRKRTHCMIYELNVLYCNVFLSNRYHNITIVRCYISKYVFVIQSVANKSSNQ